MNDKVKIHTLDQRVIRLLEQNRKLVIQNEKLKKKVMYYCVTSDDMGQKGLKS